MTDILEKGSAGDLFEKSSQPDGSHTFYVGAAWDGDVDLDLMIVPLRKDTANAGQVLAASQDDLCFFNRLDVFSGAIKHSGDALTGDAAGDDESVVIKAESVPDEIGSLVIGVIAYNVDDMSAATNTKFSIRDGGDVSAPLLFEMPMEAADVDGETVLVACVLTRAENGGFIAKNASAFHTEFGKGRAAIEGLLAVAKNYA